MKGLETGHHKIKKICDALRKETLEPAQLQAEVFLEEAKKEADAIINDAKLRAEKIRHESQIEFQKQRLAFEASLAQACRQTIESLKEKVEKQFFNRELLKLIEAPLQNPEVIAQLIQAVVGGIEKEGIQTDIAALIGSTISVQDVNHLLGLTVVNKLKDKTVLQGELERGIEVKLMKEHMTLDLSEATFYDMIATYLRKDFRQFLFGL
ncbi:MAG: V-type ATP synthase subunit E [Candidatus Rhabdochlamydia sp.]